MEEDKTLEMILDSVKKFQIKETNDCLFNILNMRNNISFNKDNDNSDIDDNTKQKIILCDQHLMYLLLRIQYQ